LFYASRSKSVFSVRAKAAAVALLVASAGAANAQPLSMEYCVDVLGPGLYQYQFTLKLDNLSGNWAPGQGWGWVIFADGRRVSPLRGVVINPASFPIGPWTQLTSSGGGHNGPTLGPVLNRWIPTQVGESLSWTATARSYVEPEDMFFSTLSHEGGAQPVNWKPITRLDCGQVLGSGCLTDGSCILVSQNGCISAGGVFGGGGSTCATANCAQPPTGACCRSSGCVVISAALCSSTGGSYQGDNTSCATAGCAPAPGNAITPPDFVAPNRIWVFQPSHSQVLTGGFRATGFRLTGHASIGVEAFQSDLLMELVPPNGAPLLIGGDGGSPLVPNSLRWASLLQSGSRPQANANAAAFDGTYSWDFGQIDGEWRINFWNNWSTAGFLTWNNVKVEMLSLATGACCLPDATCVDTARGNCGTMGGVYQGDNTLCGTCTPFLATNTAPRFGSSTAGHGQFLDLTATESLRVVQIDYAPNVANNQPTTLEVWTFGGSYIGNDLSQAGWTLHDTLVGFSSGAGVVVSRELNNPIEIGAGQTVGLYLVARQGGIRNELSPPNTFANANLSLFSALERTAPWGGNTNVRVFGGRIYYNLGTTGCYANCDGSTTAPVLNVDDFTCFVNEFASAQSLPVAQQVVSYANCDNSTVTPVLNVDDFTCFINQFAQGCP
jgi:hypothetical protein